jgi:phospholipid N-methyltransferase
MPSDFGVFFRQFRENFESTGAIAPSGRYLGRSLARFVTPTNQPRRILEVGPGTGAVTKEILRALQPQDQLDLVELNDQFVARLREKLQNDHLYKQRAGQIKIIHDMVQAVEGEQVYDLIISGLPLNNFQPEVIKSILRTFQRLLAPAGTISFFEYMFFRALRSARPGRMRDVSAVVQPWLQKNEFRRDWVWVNMPSAWVHHVRFN